MVKINPHFQKLEKKYLFSTIEKKLEELKKNFPEKVILNLGIGDVSLPLASQVSLALEEAAQEMATQEGMRGYGPAEGYLFLRKAISDHEYSFYGITEEEIFISDGAITDACAIQELFDESSHVLVTDPTYPVYKDASLLSGKKVTLIPTYEEEGFIPKPPQYGADLVYLCTPSNPTGVAMTHADLALWVKWAKEHKALLLIDNVYRCFAESKEVPDSIYAVEGASEVAIEMRSFSKSAGFTGLRCGYMVVPKTLSPPSLNALYLRRVSSKSNGVSYPIQKAAASTFLEKVKQELSIQINTYKQAASLLRAALTETNQTFFGGVDSPYIWWKTPGNVHSWDFFDTLLDKCSLLCIPGSGFGTCGEGYMRLSCFINQSTAEKAAKKLKSLLLCAT